MQTAKGTQAQSMVASELAAMFTFAVLPTLREHYFQQNSGHQGWQDYEARCTGFAAYLGIPPEEQLRITLPFAISMDWDKRHTWVRQFIASPGRCDAAREALDATIQAEHCIAFSHQQMQHHQAQVGGTAGLACDLRELLSVRRAVPEPRTRIFGSLAEVSSRRQAVEADYLMITGKDMYLQARHSKSRNVAEFITAIPEQFMPLEKISPDIHSPVEHMVGTLKRAVRERILDSDLNDDALWHGRTYQQYIQDAVHERGNGPAGSHHITSSVVKQRIICQILGAPAGKELRVEYCFGDPGEDKQTWHTVKGTAGSWIRDTKWT